MKHHLHLLLAASLGAMSIGANAAVHDWTATRIGNFDTVEVAGMNNAGQVAFGGAVPGSTRGFLYTPGSSGGLFDLGSFGGRMTVPTALNASGEVVGSSTTADGAQHAFVYRDGRMQRLGLPGETAGGAADINDRGQVLATSVGADNTFRGVIFHPAGAPTILSVPGGTIQSLGGINNRSQVYGTWSKPTDFPPSRTFFYDNGRAVDIGAGSFSFPHDMNGSGQIVGSFGRGPPFLYSDGKITAIDIGAAGAVDINDRGQVLVVLQIPVTRGAFLYSDGQLREIGDDLSLPLHLNELGQVVGAFSDEHAFFYSDDDGRTTDLTRWLMNSFHDVALVDPLRIGLNDLGQIAISATLTNRQQTLFVLTPIPEPSTYALMLAGMGTLAWIARRQRGRSVGNRGDQTPQTGLGA